MASASNTVGAAEVRPRKPSQNLKALRGPHGGTIGA